MIGAVFFASLPRTGYAGATAIVMWIGLGLIAVMAALTRFLPGKDRVSLPDALVDPRIERAERLR